METKLHLRLVQREAHGSPLHLIAGTGSLTSTLQEKQPTDAITNISTIWPRDWEGGFCHGLPGLFYQQMSR